MGPLLDRMGGFLEQRSRGEPGASAGSNLLGVARGEHRRNIWCGQNLEDPLLYLIIVQKKKVVEKSIEHLSYWYSY
jgi:hypothetical protein